MSQVEIYNAISILRSIVIPTKEESEGLRHSLKSKSLRCLVPRHDNTLNETISN